MVAVPGNIFTQRENRKTKAGKIYNDYRKTKILKSNTIKLRQ